MRDLVEILFVDDDPAEEIILRSLMKRTTAYNDPYFQKIEDFGVDFHIDKAEFDPTAIEFILREYLQPAAEV